MACFIDEKLKTLKRRRWKEFNGRGGDGRCGGGGGIVHCR